MEKSLNPFAAEYAASWLIGGVIIVPVDSNGKLLVEPQAWARKDHREIYDYFMQRPGQEYEVMLFEGQIMVLARDSDSERQSRATLKNLGLVPKFSFDIESDEDSINTAIHQSDASVDLENVKTRLGKTVEIVMPMLTYLPSEQKVHIPEIDKDTSLLETEEPGPAVSVPQTPFDKYSLLGSEEEMARFAIKAIALLGAVILMGQFGLIYAQPNTGKTLITIALLIQAVEDGRLDPRLLYYVNADDNAEGIVEKLDIFSEMGAHTLVPGQKGFDTDKLIDLMQTMIKNGQCVGVVLILDTLKCFADMMDKKRSTQFAKVVRQFVVAGGTFVGLAHTNKNPGSNGKPVYAGTSDFYEACDTACYLIPVETTAHGDKIVKFELFKKRGGGNRNEAYSYSCSNDVSYPQLVASVQQIDSEHMHKYDQATQLIADQLIVGAITAVLEQATQQKMALAKDVSATTKASRRQVIEILERYAGDDPTKHKWDFVVAERGAKVFALHPTPDG